MKIRPTRAEREADRAAKAEAKANPVVKEIDGALAVYFDSANKIEIPRQSWELKPVPIIEWKGMYSDGWNGMLVPEAFAHPAKMARALVRKIYDTLFEMRAISRESLVCDPFGGIGTTGIEGAYRGCQVVCVELEPKFVDLATYNFAMHRRRWQALGVPWPVVIQGDSRNLRQCVKTALSATPPYDVSAIISSPPFLGANRGDAGLATSAHARDVIDRGGLPKTGHSNQADYGQSEGQLSTMPTGAVDAVISSPPYERVSPEHFSAEDSARVDQLIAEGKMVGNQRGKNATESVEYGRTEGQLAELPKGNVDAIVSSPPYEEIATGAGGLNTKPARDGQQGGRDPNSASQDTDQRYGESDGQLARMEKGSVDAVVSSPPYADGGVHGESNDIDQNEVERATKAIKSIGVSSVTGYGDTEGQLARLDPDTTFWHAARDIVNESYALLKPGGVAVWVVKAFVRNKQIVDFPNDWRKLCEYCGFETLTEVRAMFTTELGKHTDLVSQEDVTTKKERKSFFRRLAEKKGSPRIDHETIFFMRKPL